MTCARAFEYLIFKIRTMRMTVAVMFGLVFANNDGVALRFV